MAILRNILTLTIISFTAASLEDSIFLIRELEKGVRSLIHLGSDGVARAYDNKGIVLNYIQFSKAELSELEAHQPYKQWTNTNGHSVPHADCANPPDHILPMTF